MVRNNKNQNKISKSWRNKNSPRFWEELSSSLRDFFNSAISLFFLDKLASRVCTVVFSLYMSLPGLLPAPKIDVVRYGQNILFYSSTKVTYHSLFLYFRKLPYLAKSLQSIQTYTICWKNICCNLADLPGLSLKSYWQDMCLQNKNLCYKQYKELSRR